MNILVTGQLGAVSYSFCSKLCAHSKVVASAEDINSSYIGNIHKAYHHRIDNDEFARLFHVYTFDSLVYFLDTPNDNTDFNAIKKLDTVLALCAKHDVKKIVVISSTCIYENDFMVKEGSEMLTSDNQRVLLQACQSLCDSYRANNGLSIITLYAPCLFGRGENKSILGKAVLQATTKNFVSIDGCRNQIIELLALEDLGELVSRILLEWPDNIRTIDLPGADIMSLAQLGDLFKNITHVTRITYTDKPIMIGPHVDSRLANTEFDWVPIISVNDEINMLALEVCKDDLTEKPTILQRAAALIRSKSFIIISIELALGYILMEYLNNITNTSVQFKYVDFRLLFVALIAIVHGLKPGIIASILAGISCIMAYAASGIDIAMLVYNIDNWLPFACYIIIGSIIGYTKDKNEKDFTFMADEKDMLEKRYVFLLELYDNALINKDQYKRQIMSYRNSFGRIYEVTKKLDSMLPDEVFKEALLALEDILDNQTISMYNTSGKTGYARLCVCSKKIMDTTKKSINLKMYEKAIDKLKKDEVWANLDRFVGYPDYIFPVYNEDQLVSLIIINKVNFDQMAMYFQNLIKILCNLINDSLVRALAYIDKLGNEIYLDDSKIMNKRAFKQLVEVRDQMEQDAIAEYSMLKINATPDTIVGIYRQLEHFFRSNDIFGQGEDNNLYIILTGTGDETLKVVIERLEKSGIFSNVV